MITIITLNNKPINTQRISLFKVESLSCLSIIFYRFFKYLIWFQNSHWFWCLRCSCFPKINIWIWFMTSLYLCMFFPIYIVYIVHDLQLYSMLSYMNTEGRNKHQMGRDETYIVEIVLEGENEIPLLGSRHQNF